MIALGLVSAAAADDSPTGDDEDISEDDITGVGAGSTVGVCACVTANRELSGQRTDAEIELRVQYSTVQ